MEHDVFISHATEDGDVARQMCSTLEHAGIRCWIAPRDIRPGSDWGASIVAGIRASRAVVLVFSDHANRSRHIPRELTHAVDADIEIVPFRIQDVPASGGLGYSLSGVQWLDATVPPIEAHLEALASLLRRTILAAPSTVPATSPTTPPPDPPALASREVPPVSPARLAEAPPVVTIPSPIVSEQAVDVAVPRSPTTLMLAMGVASIVLAGVLGVALLFFSEVPVSLGFDADGVFTTDLSLTNTLFPSELQASQFVDELLSRVAALPGVSSVGAIDVVPTREDLGGSDVTSIRHVSGGYSQTIGIPLKRGRSFNSSDEQSDSAARVPLRVILSESLASSRPAEPIGRAVSEVLETHFDKEIASGIVVGVVGDIPYLEKGFGNPGVVYVPASQDPVRHMTVLVKTRLPRTTVENSVGATLRALNGGVTFPGAKPLDTPRMSRPRFGSTVHTSLVSVAMLLAFIGIVGVTRWFRQRDLHGSIPGAVTSSRP